MKRIKLRDDREKMNIETEIEKFGLNSLFNYINIFENRALGDKDNKIIDNKLRAKLMLKLCSINYELVKDFFKVLREKSKRNEISKNEYEFSYFNKYSLTTEIIQPKFDHILFFEFSEKEDNEVKIFVGPIFNDKIGYDLNLKSLYDSKN